MSPNSPFDLRALRQQFFAPPAAPADPRRDREPPGWVRALWAFLIGSCFPGLGMVYAGRLKTGALMFLAFLLSVELDRALTAYFPPTPAFFLIYCLIAGAAIAAYLYFACTAAVLAARPSPIVPRPPWFKSTWTAAIAMFLANAALLQSTALGGAAFSATSSWQWWFERGSPMAPTLEKGDIFLVDLRAPYQPRRGDVALLHIGGDVWFRRIVGLPGDRIALAGGILSINGIPSGRIDPKPYLLEKLDWVGGAVDPIPVQYTEILPGGVTHAIVGYNDSWPWENMPEHVVPDGKIFVLADDRDGSQDSRAPSVGFILVQQARGRVSTLLWPVDRSRMPGPVK